MPGRGGLEWVRARDPGLRAVRRSARVTLVACLSFYVARYGFGDPVVAIYALFGAVASGALSYVPGTPRERARTLLAALPVAALLVALGTALAVSDWTAALGMLGVGFAVTYAGVGGPKLVGLANGLQLFYILPCFPPYQPETLGLRLCGLVVGVLLMAAAELWVWPDPSPGRYQDRLAHACEAAADALQSLALEPPVVRERSEGLLETAQQLRMSHVPKDERPVSAGARDRALCQGAAYLRHLLAQTGQLADDAAERPPAPDAARSRMLLASATACHGAARALRGEAPAPLVAPCAATAEAFEEHRARRPVSGAASATTVRDGAIALDIAYTAAFLVTSVRIALGAPVRSEATRPAEGPGPFWYAGQSPVALYGHRMRAHLTPRSVYFQNAVRIALALAAARLIAGGLDLSHGFWALLTTLTVMRTSAAGTRTTVVPAVRGTLVGAGVAALLLGFVGDHPLVYAVAMPPVFFLAFTAGPLLGLGWGQAFFTVAVATAFTQIAPAGPELAAFRIADVVTGVLTGTLVGLLAWPRGGTGELGRACSRLLDQGTRAVTQITDCITGTGTMGDALSRARLAQLIAEASYAQFATERDTPGAGPALPTDFQAIMLAGNRVLTMGQTLVDHCPPGALAAWPLSAAHLRDAAHHLRLTTLPLTYDLRSGTLRPAPDESPQRSVPTDRTVIADVCAASGGRAPDPLLYYAVDAAIWLASLQRVVTAVRRPAEDPVAAQC
ncbi:FUSC family protein [Actinacidiphila glaucinigra]|uniref:FUSC family protein n=1 Tax=Actinacidiphila glaucinigra TaxID=235986 RepID=UPI002DD992EF|nr:FUSC family protein [Actinacidiphila glaucinigra]WSD64141.1 FUSC family protein [Actinacidiphila glaucinigra]